MTRAAGSPWMIALLIGGGVLFGAPSVAWANAGTLCGPFAVVASAAGPAEALREGGVTAPGAGASGLASGKGSIVPLEAPRGVSDAAGGAATGASTPSEAILALPKNDAGQIPTDFELGDGAKIADSYFSPVTCATIARIEGPPGASIEQLVTVVPDGSALVRNDVYASAAAGVETVGSAAAEAPAPDPYASLQYGLAITGIREARAAATGDGVTIALLDSAPETAHDDLAAAKIRPVGGDAAREIGVHGTLMAGVISATEGNGFGIAGVAPDAELVSIPICRPTGAAGGRCTIYDIVRGLDQAWDADASIVNLSLSGPPNVLLERGVARLEELGAVVVAAAGNEGTQDKRYPAAYPSVIGVGAIDAEGRRFAGGNRGPWVELLAPGVDVLSTVPGNAFAFGNGTSLAAAHVSGLLAVVTEATGNAKLARGELFRAVSARASRSREARKQLPRACEILARTERPCGASSATAPASSADPGR